MESNLEPPPTTINGNGFLSPPSSTFAEEYDFYIDDMSNCSTPYVSAPSSPGRFNTLVSSGFYYSAPASPMHFVLATAPARSSAAGGLIPTTSDASSNGSFEFDFSSRFENSAPLEIGSSMSSADELFLNGQIRPMKLCAHLQRPQQLPCLTLHDSERENESENEDDENISFQMCSRDLRLRNSRSQRRRTRSLSPLRSSVPFNWYRADDIVSTPKKEGECEGGEREKDSGGTESETTTGSGSSSRCSSAGRSSKRWVFLKDFLRSKSEGRSNNKFWHNINISFSPAKEKREKLENANVEEKKAEKEVNVKKGSTRRSMRMHHHYAMNRAQAEQMRKKTYLPYRQGLLGCLGFNSKTYGAFHGFARAFNPVSSTSTPG